MVAGLALFIVVAVISWLTIGKKNSEAPIEPVEKYSFLSYPDVTPLEFDPNTSNTIAKWTSGDSVVKVMDWYIVELAKTGEWEIIEYPDDRNANGEQALQIKRSGERYVIVVEEEAPGVTEIQVAKYPLQ